MYLAVLCTSRYRTSYLILSSFIVKFSAFNDSKCSQPRKFLNSYAFHCEVPRAFNFHCSFVSLYYETLIEFLFMLLWCCPSRVKCSLIVLKKLSRITLMSIEPHRIGPGLNSNCRCPSQTSTRCPLVYFICPRSFDAHSVPRCTCCNSLHLNLTPGWCMFLHCTSWVFDS